MRFVKQFLFVVLVCGAWGAAWAQEQPAIALSGAIVKPTQLTAEMLSKYPAVEMDVSFMTSKGTESAHYKGVLLWTLLQDLGLKDLQGHHEELKHTFTVTGSDGYLIAFSMGEIAPEFGNTQMLIALTVDGKPLAGDKLRLIVPGDERGARSVKDMAKIELR